MSLRETPLRTVFRLPLPLKPTKKCSLNHQLTKSPGRVQLPLTCSGYHAADPAFRSRKRDYVKALVRDPTDLEITGPGLSRVLDQNSAPAAFINKSINRRRSRVSVSAEQTISSWHRCYRQQEPARRNRWPKPRPERGYGWRTFASGADKIVCFWLVGGPMTWLIVGQHRYFVGQIF